MKKPAILALMTASSLGVIGAAHYYSLPLYEWTRPLILFPVIYATVNFGKRRGAALLLMIAVALIPFQFQAMTRFSSVMPSINFFSSFFALGMLGLVTGGVVRKENERADLWGRLRRARERILAASDEESMLSVLSEEVANTLKSDIVEYCFLRDDGRLVRVSDNNHIPLPDNCLLKEIVDNEELFIRKTPGMDPRLEITGSYDVKDYVMNVVALPLRFGERRRGVLVALNSRTDSLGDDPSRMIVDVASFMESSIAMTEKRREALHHSVRREEIKEAFSSYVSSSVANEILKNPDKIELGGRLHEASVVFTKIENIKQLRDKLPQDKLFEMMNRFFSVAMDTVFEHNGTMDKFVFDSVMAFWGAPLSIENHEELAVRCAVSMIEKTKLLNKEWEAQGIEGFKLGAGVNSGPVIAGNIGADRRMEYTIIGDTVNTAARIKDMTGTFGVPLLASESVREKTKNIFSYDRSFRARAKGKSDEISVYGITL